MNTDVTIDPRQIVSFTDRRTALTVDPNSSLPKTSGSDTLKPGDRTESGYLITEILSESGGQSRLYLCIKDGQTCVFKLYHPGIVPDWKIQNLISSEMFDGLCRILETGIEGSSRFEVLEYYPGGSLENYSRMTVKDLKELVLPGVLQGLHTLHENGIVHGDLKPSNILFDPENGKAVLTDFGSSCRISEKTDSVVLHPHTPEYAPPVSTVSGQPVYTPAYDYGSLGLILIYLTTGRSLLQGLSEEEIYRAWKDGLQIPYEVRNQFGSVITGLLESDEEKRWGYDEVYKWLNVFKRRRRPSRKKNKTDSAVPNPMIFGIENGELKLVSTVYELVREMRNSWDQARLAVRKNELIMFVSQFDSDKAKKLQKLSEEPDDDSAVFKALLILDDQNEMICYRQKSYRNYSEYLSCLETLEDEEAALILKSGLLGYYLRAMKYDETLVRRIEDYSRMTAFDSQKDLLSVCYALSGRRDLFINGHQIHCLDDLILEMMTMTVQDMNDLLRRDDFLAWLTRLGYRQEADRLTKFGD